LTGKPFKFKEIDLLQEHLNFWLKVQFNVVNLLRSALILIMHCMQVIYNAKGVNKSWKWLATIAVCIYSLRAAMKTVQSAFEISSSGVRHTVPDMSAEVNLIADNLKSEKIQEYVQDRRGNDAVDLVRDLLAEGSKYANSKTAFSKFRKSTEIIENLGVQENAPGSAADDGDDEADDSEDYEATAEDLALDDEEPLYDFVDLLTDR
jgi:hypothetical protein